MKRFDLHTHSRYSDGTCTPQQIVARAKAAGVEVVFLTDHDTVTGYPEAAAAAREAGVDMRCGIEINTVYKDNVHILGYGFRWDDAGFQKKLEEFRARRRLRMERIVENLQKIGLDIAFSDVAAAGHEALGRPHVADALRRKGIVSSRQEAFNRFLIKGKPGYVESLGPSPEEAITMIKEAGGFSSLAHPETVGDEGPIGDWIKLGLEGIEAYYSTHKPSQIVHYLRLAESHGLLTTGGTDFHGPGSGRDKPLGIDVPDEVFGRFMERLSRCS